MYFFHNNAGINTAYCSHTHKDYREDIKIQHNRETLNQIINRVIKKKQKTKVEEMIQKSARKYQKPQAQKMHL